MIFLRSRHFYAARRGFALPLVVLLALVSSLVVVVMLDRSNVQARMVKRQLDNYRDDHFAKGMQEAIDSWMKSVATKPMADLLEEDGHAMDLELADGVLLKLYVFDAQGSVLTEFGMLQGDSITDAQGVAMAYSGISVDELKKASKTIAENEEKIRTAGRYTPVTLTRRYGSPAVSVSSSPDPVLAAVANFAGGGDVVSQLLEAVHTARAEKPIGATELADIIAKIQTEPEIRAILQRLLTAQPTFWQIEARLYRTDQLSTPAAVYSGYSLLSGRGNTSRDRAGAGMTRLSVILDWKRVAER